jgi:hypothetical protein
MKMNRRLDFLSQLKSYLSKIDSPVLYLEESLYLSLSHILDEIL